MSPSKAAPNVGAAQRRVRERISSVYEPYMFRVVRV